MCLIKVTVRLDVTEIDQSVDTIYFEGFLAEDQVYFFSGDRLLMATPNFREDDASYDVSNGGIVHVLTHDPATFDFVAFYQRLHTLSLRDYLMNFFDRSQDVDLQLERAL